MNRTNESVFSSTPETSNEIAVSTFFQAGVRRKSHWGYDGLFNGSAAIGQPLCSATMAAFDDIVGFTYLKGVHLNDSKKSLGSRVDRHECIGRGEIGLDAFRFVMTDPRFDDIPMVLETPDREHWAEEIELLNALEV